MLGGMSQRVYSQKKELHDENRIEYHFDPFNPCRSSLVLAGDQYPAWKFHDGSDPMGSLRRYRFHFGNHIDGVCEPPPSYTARELSGLVPAG